MVLKKGLSTKKRRRALPEADEDGSDAQQILQPIEECWWDFFTQEIFHRLPANQLQTIKAVCTNWFRTISNPNFIRFHLKIYNESRIRVVVKNEGRLIEYKFNIINSSDSQETKQLPCPPAIPRTAGSILGSCDGLLCLHFEGSIGVYNPSTGKYFSPKSSLRDTNYYVSCSWFGHHPCSAEYLLVLGNFYREVGVYKFNRRSHLQKIHSTSCSVDSHVYFTFSERVGTLLHGAIHWPAQRNPHDHRQVIYAYHLDDNKYFEITPPVQPPRFGFNLGVAQGCLFAIFRSTNAQLVCEFEMWIMKEYGVQQSWIKYANIQGLNSFVDLNCHNHVNPLGFFPNGDLILDVDRYMLIKYSFIDNKAKLLTRREYGNAIMCADSLVSPKIVGT